jgi:membrane-associated phospholipid phosphatase
VTEPATGGTVAARPATSSPLGTRIARLITEALTPAVLVAGIAIAVAWHSRSPGWGVAVAMFASAVPLAYIIRGVRRGRYKDHHVDVREHRPAVILVAAASVIVGLTLMLLLDAPRDLVALVVAMLAGLALTFAATKWWGKVSFHTAVAAGTATTLVLVFGPWLHFSWLLVGAIGWSRVRLEQHTVAQVIVGAVLGTSAAGLVFPVIR